MEQLELPLYDDCFGKAMSSEHKNMTALERFIYNWEPCGPNPALGSTPKRVADEEWRRDLAAVLAEAHAR